MSNLFRYFSQYGEDFLLWHFFDFNPRGFFIDIGAFDGIHLSNSYSFELAGWQGICVEPHPYYFTLCTQNRPKSICINKACGKEEKHDVLFHVDNTGLFSSLQNIGEEENIKGHFGQLKDVNIEINAIHVDIVPLNTILASVPPDSAIDFVSIDVEGAELDVFYGFDLGKYTPRVIIVETNTPEAIRDIDGYLQDNGYMFARRTNANSFYVTTEEDKEKLSRIELDCIIEKQIHPLGAEYTVPSYLNGLVLYRGESCNIFAKLAELARIREQLAQSREQLVQSREQLVQSRENNQKLDALLKDHVQRIDERNKKIKQIEASLNAAFKEIESLQDAIRYREAKILELDGKLAKTFDVKIRKIFGKI